MASGLHRYDLRDRHLIGIIGDQDTVSGMLLAGVGNVDSRQKRNFFVVDSSNYTTRLLIFIFFVLVLWIETSTTTVEEAFKDLTGRRDIAILLINQHIADTIRYLVDDYDQMLPALLEIPSKDHPYNPDKDTIFKRVSRLFSQD